MNKKLTIVIIVVVILLVAGLYSYDIFKPAEFSIHRPVILTLESLPSYLSGVKIIQDLPEDSNIQVNFGGNKYFIHNGVVERGMLKNPEVIISLPEGYILRIGEVGLCQAASEAVKNREISVGTEMSEAELAWKYKKLLRYGACVGL